MHPPQTYLPHLAWISPLHSSQAATVWWLTNSVGCRIRDSAKPPWLPLCSRPPLKCGDVRGVFNVCHGVHVSSLIRVIFPALSDDITEVEKYLLAADMRHSRLEYETFLSTSLFLSITCCRGDDSVQLRFTVGLRICTLDTFARTNAGHVPPRLDVFSRKQKVWVLTLIIHRISYCFFALQSYHRLVCQQNVPLWSLLVTESQDLMVADS